MSLKYIYKIFTLFSQLSKGPAAGVKWSKASPAPGSAGAAHVMDLASSQEVPRVDFDPDPEVILEVDPCCNVVIARNVVTGEALKYGEKYATFLQATLGAPGYFPGGMGTATCTWEVPYLGV